MREVAAQFCAKTGGHTFLNAVSGGSRRSANHLPLDPPQVSDNGFRLQMNCPV